MKAKVGELCKSDPQGKNWKKRWFMLAGGRMQYFENRTQQQKGAVPKGYFLVDDIQDVVDRDHGLMHKPPLPCPFYIKVRL